MVVKRPVKPDVESFIDKGADVKAKKSGGFKNVLIRVPIKLLDDLDNLIEQKPWLNRTQLIVEAIDEKLKRED